MNFYNSLRAVLAGFIFVGCLSAAAQQPGAGRQAFVDSPGYYNYLLWLPPNYHPGADAAWPLMVYLHGGEGLSSGGVTSLNENIPGILQLPAVVDAQYPSLNECIIVSPLRTDLFWLNSRVDEMLKEITNAYPVDSTRVYLTGMSLGGFGSWAMASVFSERFAAIAPLAANGDIEQAFEERELIFQIVFGPDIAAEGFAFRDDHPGETFVGNPAALANTPAWAFVADRDPLIPLELVQSFVGAIQDAGGDARLTVFNGLLHDVGPLAYNEDLFQWMLSHQRAPASFASDWMMYE